MSRVENKKIADETRRITEQGYYELDGKHITLEYGMKNGTDKVIVIEPCVVEDIADDEEAFIAENLTEYSSCEYKVVNMDSFEADSEFGKTDRVLVMNFANARHPGGGFLSGASAQEESLCRCSTLFASINSKEARAMYDYNNRENDEFDSDHMLISPFVDVFRKADGELLEESFSTAVLTIPAPNLNGRARNVGRSKIEYMMNYKIQNLLMIAAKYEYDTLILGAWGCGAFGHDAKDVSGYFADVLVNQEYYKFFRKIIFAVYDKTPSQYNFNSFLDQFGKGGVWQSEK